MFQKLFHFRYNCSETFAFLEQLAHSDDMDIRYASLIFDNIPTGIFTIDESLNINSFNRAAERLTGWSQHEVCGRRCRDIFRSNHCVGRCFLQNSIEGGQQHHDHEVKIRRRDGSELLVSISTAALRDNDGRVIGGVEMMRDLTAIDTLRRELKSTYTSDDIISKSRAMRDVRELLPLVARSESTVLIEGEPGTGKELVARAIHNLGPRKDGPFVAINCGALPDTLIESELFGHAQGAFTDAKTVRQGRFALAEGGTLLLDELCEISAAAQVKLLRVLQEREYVPLGTDRPIKTNVRILAATNQDLAQQVNSGKFRQDLYFRLNVVRIVLPPLRARWEDISILIDHFIQRFNAIQGRRINRISERARAALMAYPYPGNVRELENAIEHAFVICGGNTIQIDDLPPHLRSITHQSNSAPQTHQPAPQINIVARPLESAEASTIRKILEHHNGNRTRAAAELGIARNTLWRKMKKHGVG